MGLLERVAVNDCRYTHNFPRSLLIMDQFGVYMMLNIRKELDDCRTDFIFVPKGTTFFSQSCDMFVNKPLKDGVRTCCQSYMMNQKDTEGKFSYSYKALI